MTRKLPRPALLALVGLEVVSAAVALRDLAGRSDDQVRGSKIIWRTLIAVNPGNSLAYWAVGRRSG